MNYLIGLADSEYEKLEARVKEITAQQHPEAVDTSMLEIEKMILLRSIDALWVEHIDTMSHLRQGIGLRGYGQRDPLVEYKKEAYRMFLELQSNIQKQVVYGIYKVGMAGPAIPDGNIGEVGNLMMSGAQKTMQAGGGSFASMTGPAAQGAVTRTTSAKQPVGAQVAEGQANEPIKSDKIGRNDPCPCGSGKKYKKCGAINAPEHKQ